MDKQKHNTSFTQLSDTELQSIIGGDWWTDFIKLIPKPFDIAHPGKRKQG
ncbi:TPA: ComC/BlpC family leader-containing pheromone/bacteriocin [Streptococcus suis]|nr:ComC/BlpC family leader-containing pheromone/bacteriocin [Streptococcus suis]